VRRSTERLSKTDSTTVTVADTIANTATDSFANSVADSFANSIADSVANTNGDASFDCHLHRLHHRHNQCHTSGADAVCHNDYKNHNSAI